MKLLQCYLFAFVFLFCQYGFCQSRDREVDEIEKETKITKDIDDVNDDIKNANSAVKGTVADSKETFNELKGTIESLFGSGAGKNGKSVISIHIPSVDYDNENLNQMYGQLVKVKGVKKPSKNFKNGSVSIQASYKNGADDLWQSIPFEARKGFKLLEISDDTILLKLKNTEINN